MKNAIYRALRTFLQTAFGYIATNLVLYFSSPQDFSDLSSVKSLLVGLGMSAAASGLAAVMNLEKKHKGFDDDTFEEADE